MENKWVLLPSTQEQRDKGKEISSSLSLHPVVGLLLAQRGVWSTEEAERFLNPDLKDLHDPFLMANMESAVTRLNTALTRREKILVYGDYDADGITAVALVYKCLRRYTSSLDYYIPDRYEEGSGFSFQGVQYAADHGVTLVITLDCGVKSVDQIARAQALGIDVIVCDHHRPDDAIPSASAILDTKCPGSQYPFDHLCGCGVAFKFMQGFLRSNGLPISELEVFLDLVAVSIAADIVPIIGENRILAYNGLRRINYSPCPGIKGIIDICGIGGKRNISTGDLVFKIGPLLNASGRMENGRESVALLLLKDRKEVADKSQEINRYNEERREVDKRITEEAYAAVSEGHLESNKSIVIYNPKWHKGVIGIVASRLAETYHRPVIIFSRSPEMITGSARSHGAFDVYKTIEECRDLVENFGGHPYAVGLSLRPENLPAFTERFQRLVEAEEFVMSPHIAIDATLPLREVTFELLSDIKRLSPFGQDNHVPVFYTPNVRDSGRGHCVGKENEHLRLGLTDDTVGTPINAIGFNMSRYLPTVRSGNPFHVCYTVEEFARRNGAVQLLIKDIRSTHP
ncbi:MAG: single-stranded-DNA-specific exonuclease RecJ [Tannerellaceae bacterium]|jgi:single-stranded-DNA-specific exonuclease|nr:single-stranded-DNA-specific exonuclease RecJ [Tannerellaceae bacterium]